MKRTKVLLLGNGINRIDNPYSWGDLMNDLLDYTELRESISSQDKPFPLLYEEIFLRWGRSQKRDESNMRHKIRQLIENITPNDLHRELLDLNLSDILTTNYDYNLEYCLPNGLKDAEYVPPVKGTKYPLLRKRRLGDKIIWHIHGECEALSTIILGYEQYAGYIQNIRNYVVKGTRYSGVSLPPLTKKLKEGPARIHTWVDHFFYNDLFILGLSLDFVEMHLWWLLDYRARKLKDERYHFKNRVVYMYPQPEQEWIKPRLDLLCACDVECLPVPVVNNDWKGMYRNAIDVIRRHEVKN